jgi:hypothetical protein
MSYVQEFLHLKIILRYATFPAKKRMLLVYKTKEFSVLVGTSYRQWLQTLALTANEVRWLYITVHTP